MSLVDALSGVVVELERQGVRCVVGGPMASSAHGVPRATNDVDLAVDLREEHVDDLRGLADQQAS